MTVRVMIVDDQPITRSGLRFLVDSIPGYEVVTEAEDGAEAVAKARDHDVDLVLMDLRMPRIDGAEAARQLARMPRPPRIIIVTTFGVDEQALDALDAGADAFLFKGISPEELSSALDVVMSGGRLISPEMLSFIMQKTSKGPVSHHVKRKELLLLLTDSERRVLSLLGAGLSNLEIAETLYLSVSSVKTYVSRLLQKLDLENRTQAAVLAYELDFLHE